jgi:hypothetical protein
MHSGCRHNEANRALNRDVQRALSASADVQARKWQNEQSTIRVFPELGDAHCASPQQIFNDPEREVAFLKVDHLRRRSEATRHSDKVGIGGHNPEMVILRPCPDILVVSLLQSDIANVRQAREQQAQPVTRRGDRFSSRSSFKQLQPRFALRPVSAA